MSTHRRSRIDRGAAERLLAGAAPHPQDGPDGLVLLLAGMRAPAHPDELLGEEPAMAAYRAANLGPVLQPRRRSMLETAVAKLLTLKAAAAAAAVITATGGVALAASAGVLPNPLDGSPTARPSAHATGKPSTAGANKAGAAAPSPSMVGLCRAYAAGAGDNPGKALENPAFQALITSAGSKEEVAGYCDDVLAAHEAAQTAASKAPAARSSKAPATHPSAGPDSHPTGAPATKPTEGAGSRPTAVPTAPATS
jgi:hypothetical protein